MTWKDILVEQDYSDDDEWDRIVDLCRRAEVEMSADSANDVAKVMPELGSVGGDLMIGLMKEGTPAEWSSAFASTQTDPQARD